MERNLSRRVSNNSDRDFVFQQTGTRVDSLIRDEQRGRKGARVRRVLVRRNWNGKSRSRAPPLYKLWAHRPTMEERYTPSLLSNFTLSSAVSYSSRHVSRHSKALLEHIYRECPCTSQLPRDGGEQPRREASEFLLFPWRNSFLPLLLGRVVVAR